MQCDFTSYKNLEHNFFAPRHYFLPHRPPISPARRCRISVLIIRIITEFLRPFDLSVSLVSGKVKYIRNSCYTWIRLFLHSTRKDA